MPAKPSTGLSGLDSVLHNLIKGDNVVWQVDSLEDYRRFAAAFASPALDAGHRVVYMRFAGHEPIFEPGEGLEICKLDASEGFESFSTQIHSIIKREGKGVFYVFDCLSDLLNAWATDLMIGNFFSITCPYLYELDTIAYFALLRNNHSFKTIARIRETTQLLLDLYSYEGSCYVHPLKVWKRYSPTMFLPHMLVPAGARRSEAAFEAADRFVPITNSTDASRLISQICETGLEPSQRALVYWDRLFIKAEQLMRDEKAIPAEKNQALEHLCKVMIGREDRILTLARKHFSLDDLLTVKNRLVGSGYIGGKAVGMLLANSIVRKDTSRRWDELLEPHDSFFVGSDVFYTYLVENGCWKLRLQQKRPEGYFKAAPELRQRLLSGRFPDQVREALQEVTEYFGQSPIIVRSSSILEDAFGSAFAGKYESFFLVNQGAPEDRYARLEDAIRKVYASTMSEDALVYRKQRGLAGRDEQMALLIQRVSGSYRNGYFLPDLGGVGISHNIFAWNPGLDPKAGMLRLVVGLGTRAVNRVEDDYPRTVALDEPLLQPLSGSGDARRFQQHKVDLLNIETNAMEALDLQELLAGRFNLPVDLLAKPDLQVARMARGSGRLVKGHYWILTFHKLLLETSFVRDMQEILKRLESHYEYPVDIEFTVNFSADGRFLINLLQCRPLQTRGHRAAETVLPEVPRERVLFQCNGCFMGGNLSEHIRRVIYVDPAAYGALPQVEKYDVARLIGLLNRQIGNRRNMPALLVGPGRWGTTTPSLGVPVRFAEINNIAVLVELEFESMNLSPDLSFGTHFFQDLVETDIFYAAVFPNREGFVFNGALLEKTPSELGTFVPQQTAYTDAVKVFDLPGDGLRVVADVVGQKLVCFMP
jgi:hypothetical protein